MGFGEGRSWKGHGGSLAQSPYFTEGETEAQRGVATAEGHTRVSVELGPGPGPPDSQTGPSLLAEPCPSLPTQAGLRPQGRCGAVESPWPHRGSLRHGVTRPPDAGNST